jgi:hypothetical protein
VKDNLGGHLKKLGMGVWFGFSILPAQASFLVYFSNGITYRILHSSIFLHGGPPLCSRVMNCPSSAVRSEKKVDLNFNCFV